MSTASTATLSSGRRPLSRVVRHQPARAYRGPGVLYFSVLLSLTVIFSLAYVWLRMQRIDLAYRLSRNQQREQALDNEQQRLLYTLARLKDPKRLEAIAREKLGLAPPAPGQVVALDAPREDRP